jgi:predicted  nucleic acid-binding Zn-ribbon protein
MPHQCTECGYTISDGSDEIFNGCGECGNDTFSYAPSSETSDNNEEQPPMKNAENETANIENGAQHNARSDVVSEDEIPEQESSDDTEDGHTEAVRRELNNQFESIRILSPGEYELNLMKLYENEDRVISLRQDGKYAIHISD